MNFFVLIKQSRMTALLSEQLDTQLIEKWKKLTLCVKTNTVTKNNFHPIEDLKVTTRQQKTKKQKRTFQNKKPNAKRTGQSQEWTK